MKIDDVRTYGRPACMPLPNGALLRYHAEDGTVRIIAYPHRPNEWEQLPVLHEDVPAEGWRHASSCV